MGEVYEAVDRELGQRVALKTIRSELAASESMMARVRQEILLARQVTHPNVCRIFDLCYHDAGEPGSSPARQPLLSMELVAGETLAARLRRKGPPPPEVARRIALQISRGVAAAHRVGVVHCDLKSSNIMLAAGDPAAGDPAAGDPAAGDPAAGDPAAPVAAFGERGTRAVVMDFGLASTLSIEAIRSQKRRSPSTRPGTPGYMAPELRIGEPATPATDVYSLGAVFYEMLTGERPPKSGEESALFHDPSAVDAFWRSILSRCLATDPGQRFPNAAALVAELGAGLPLWRRRPVILAAGALTLLAAVVYVTGWRPSGWRPSGWRPAPSPEPSATTAAGESQGEVTLRPSLALLDLHNLDPDPRYQWVATVLPELLAAKLALGETIRLITRDTLRQLGLDCEPEPSDGDIGKTLARFRAATGADFVLTGGYRASPEEEGALVIDLELHDTRSGELVDTVRVAGRAEDPAPVIDAAVAAILLRLGLPPSAASSPSGEPAADALLPAADAGRLYAAGLHELESFRAEAAVVELRAAVAADPGFLLARIALARAHLELGDLGAAAREAQKALELGELPREHRLTLEALAAEAVQDFTTALNNWQALWAFFPDEVGYGLGVARAASEMGQGDVSLATVERLRALPQPLAGDPRIDLAEAVAAGVAGDYQRQREAARRAGEKGRRLDSLLLEAQAAREASNALRYSRSVSEGLAEARRAQRLFKQLGHEAGVAAAMLEESMCLEALGELQSATDVGHKALELYRSLGHRSGIAAALTRLGNVSRIRLEIAAAHRFLAAAGAEYEALGNQVMVARNLYNTGTVYFEDGNYEKALEIIRSALTVTRSLGDRKIESMALNAIGGIHYRNGDLEAAVQAMEASLALKQQLHDRLRMIASTNNLAVIYLQLPDLARAEELFNTTYEDAEKMSATTFVARSLWGLGEIRYLEDRQTEAVEILERACELLGSADQPDVAQECRLLLAACHLEQRGFARRGTDGAFPRRGTERGFPRRGTDGAFPRRGTDGALARALELAEAVAADPAKPWLAKAAHTVAAAVLTRQDRLVEARAELAKAPEAEEEAWEIRGRILEARHLELAGQPQEALAKIVAAEELAREISHKVLELEARIARCSLLPAAPDDAGAAASCFAEVRRQAEGLGLGLLVRWTDEKAAKAPR